MKKSLKAFAGPIVILIGIIVLVMLFAIYVMPSLSRGQLGFDTPWGMSFKLDPPREKLLDYMNEKYEDTFYEITEKDYTEHIHGTYALNWANNYNGIVVCTDSHPGEFFHVRKEWSHYTDDYGCYLVKDEAQEIIRKMLSEILEREVKIYCDPDRVQNYEYTADMTAEEFLKKCDYWIYISVCDDGESKEADLEKTISALKEFYKDDNTDRHITLKYCSPENFAQINTDWKTEQDLEWKNLKWRTNGYINKDISEFKWKKCEDEPYIPENEQQ